MAGKTRGRGRSQLTFNVDALGFGRGDSLPTSSHTPSPIFPTMQFRPVPLHMGEEVEYLLALKQELRASRENLPFYIRASSTKKDVAHYSDKYQNSEQKNNTIEWSPDWSRMPTELCIKVRQPQKKSVAPQIKQKSKIALAKEEVLKKLETLEKREEEQHPEEEEDEEKKQEHEADEHGDEDYDEEELEDETDYIMSYFDNGDDFGGDSDDNVDEAVY